MLCGHRIVFSYLCITHVGVNISSATLCRSSSRSILCVSPLIICIICPIISCCCPNVSLVEHFRFPIFEFQFPIVHLHPTILVCSVHSFRGVDRCSSSCCFFPWKRKRILNLLKLYLELYTVHLISGIQFISISTFHLFCPVVPFNSSFGFNLGLEHSVILNQYHVLYRCYHSIFL